MIPGRLTLAVSLVSLLVTAVIAGAIWESYYPDLDREGLRERRAYYEKKLRGADISWREALYYKRMEGSGAKP
jgi:hypothetical protein